VLPPLEALAGAALRVWRLDRDRWTLVAGDGTGASTRGPVAGARDTSWLALPDSAGLFLEVAPRDGASAEEVARRVLPVVQGMLDAGRSTALIAHELAARYEEIDLLYSIGELLGHAQSVDEVAAVILREVSAVVGARAAALRVHDDARGILHAVASLGTSRGAVAADVVVANPESVVARAFRSGQIETGAQPNWVPGDIVAVPIVHAVSGQPARVIGTLALADRAGGGAFTREETKLIAAVATQIGAALENARLVAGERARQRLERELELAHDLQVRLMPTPAVLRGEADVAARSDPATSLGGDFYTFARLGRGRIGVLVGDVATHGFAAALIAAEVLAAAGIHAHATARPDDMLALLGDSLRDELAKTEMYLTVWYGILDPSVGELDYSNAGHIHAFRLPTAGPMERLSPTAPPLGLVEGEPFGHRAMPWDVGKDRLVLFTDGLGDQTNAAGERYGEARIIARLERDRDCPPGELVQRVFDDVIAFGGTAIDDDRTLVILRI
jgi:sigma-B regulation protein RsbU (phosphoserine phosphatase)